LAIGANRFIFVIIVYIIELEDLRGTCWITFSRTLAFGKKAIFIAVLKELTELHPVSTGKNSGTE